MDDHIAKIAQRLTDEIAQLLRREIDDLKGVAQQQADLAAYWRNQCDLRDQKVEQYAAEVAEVRNLRNQLDQLRAKLTEIERTRENAGRKAAEKRRENRRKRLEAENAAWEKEMEERRRAAAVKIPRGGARKVDLEDMDDGT